MAQDRIRTQYVIKDPDLLSGESFGACIGALRGFVAWEDCLLCADRWLTRIATPNTEADTVLVNTDDFISRIGDIAQIEWATVFLCNDESEIQTVCAAPSIKAAIAASTVAVRAVDNIYIYLYSSLDSVREYAKSLPALESVTQVSVENLAIPF